MTTLSLRGVGIVALLIALVPVTGPVAAMTSEAFHAARGSYDLSDGRAMHLGGSPRRPLMELDGAAAQPLTTGPNGQVVTADGHVALHFITRPNGLVTGVRLTALP